MRQKTRHWLIVALAMFMFCQSVTADSVSDTSVSDSVKPQEPREVGRSLVYTMSIEGAIGATTAERIEEAVAPERVELIESIRQKDTLIGELASEKRGLEEELARYKQKEKKRERYQRKMQKPQSQKTKRKQPR